MNYPAFSDELFEYLKTFVAPERIQLFEQIVDKRMDYITLVLEDVYQTQNASALVRTADALGVAEINVIEQKNVYRPNKDIAKGANKWVKINTFREDENALQNCILSLKNSGYKLVVTSPAADGFTPENIPLDKPLALCFGTELEGATEQLINAADYHLQIPMYGFTESYNVSVAAGIVMYTLTQRYRNSELFKAISEDKKNELILHWLRNHSKQMGYLERMFWEQKGVFSNF
jgi:tRNA (guanosine-2'-O-)-methyltransferase